MSDGKEMTAEERAFAAANARRTRTEDADKRLDAALRDLSDWRAYCKGCGEVIVGTVQSLTAHAMECCDTGD